MQKVESGGIECDGIFIFQQVRPKLGCLLHKTGFVDSDMHTTVLTYVAFTFFEEKKATWMIEYSPGFILTQNIAKCYCNGCTAKVSIGSSLRIEPTERKILRVFKKKEKITDYL